MTFQGLGPVLFGAVAQIGPTRVAIAAAGVATVATALLVPRQLRDPGQPRNPGKTGSAAPVSPATVTMGG